MTVAIRGKTGEFIPLHKCGFARTGVLVTRKGVIRTPHFAPVATRGALKGVTTQDLPPGKYDLLLANTYHLLIRPGIETIEALGGIHSFLSWKHTVLTDSGGFQVYSLAHLTEVTDRGVKFKNHLDGKEIFLTPEKVVEVQETLKTDIAMVLDECLPYGADEKALKRAVERTFLFAERGISARRDPSMLLFGIVQGGTSIPLRYLSLKKTTSLNMDGYAIGGVAVGEPLEKMYEVIKEIAPSLPEDRVRYLMGVGRPDNIVRAVEWGVDLFDCVLPTRNARNGKIMTMKGFIHIQRKEYAQDRSPLEEECTCPTCATTSKGVLRYLYKIREFNYVRLATIHNLYFMARLMDRIRDAIASGTLPELRMEMEKAYREEGKE